MEAASGGVAAVEVKAGATVRTDDLRAIRGLADRLGDRFLRGIVLYTGDQAVSFGERLHAWPITALWSGNRAWEIVAGPTPIELGSLPALAQAARETKGRAVAEELATRAADPHDVVEVHTRLRALPAV